MKSMWQLPIVLIGGMAIGIMLGGVKPLRSSFDDLAPASAPMHFLVAAGGGAPSYNEIALEKNVRYFQR
jgi:hypothetical protein